MSPFVESVVAAVRGVVGQGPVALHEPEFQGNEWAYVKECLDTGWVSSVGKFVDRFEHDLASYTGAGYAVAVVNGTAALQVALTVSGVRAGDEVLVPAMSFVATANAVCHAGALPHFVDSDENTLGMSMPALEAHLDEIVEMREGKAFNRHTGRRLAAVVPMHTFGHPVDLSSLAAIADRYGLAVVEDAAESLGSYFDGRHTGTFGRCGVLSFNGNKIITTGGGGAILTDDAELARRAKHLTTTAKAPHRWSFSHDEIAFNYRLPNLNAALGCAQLEQVGAFLAGKRRLAERYETAFADLSGVTFVKERAGTQANYWLQTLLLDVDHAVYRDDLLAALNDAGFMSRPVWDLLSGLPPYRESPAAALSVAQSLAERIVNIPSSPGLADG